MSGRGLGVAALSVLAIALAAAAPARAYVRYKTTSSTPFFWPQTCVPLTAYSQDVGDLTAAQALQAATAAAAAWSTPQVNGTFLAIDVEAGTGTPPAAVYDGYPSLVFRTESWCNTSGPNAPCYDPAAAAITSVFVKNGNGKIVDADIEVNAKYFMWTDFDLPMSGANGADKYDLRNALTHEMGHLIGLDHPCLMMSPPDPTRPPPTDNLGNPAPACSEAPQAVLEATMFPSTTVGDTSKRTLTPDEEQAVRDIYPVDQDPKVCPPPGLPPGGGCRLAPGAAGGGTAVLLLAAALAWTARRRKRQS